MSVKVKICGHTRRDDALASADAGADMLGFIFYPRSKRFIAFEHAAEWLGDLPSHCTRVGVFVDASAAEIRRAIGSGLVDLAQLHGDESPEFCQSLGVPFFKALRIETEASLEKIRDYPGDIILLDSPAPGSGTPFNWELARQAVGSATSTHVLLAGGLTPENVRAAIRTVTPWGVDVATGVESATGIKDVGKVRKFIDEVRRVSGGS